MHRLKDFAIAASLANLLLAREWVQLIYPFRRAYFDHPLSRLGFFSLAVVFLLYALVLYAIFRLAHASQNRRPFIFSGCYAVLIAVFLLALNELRTATNLSVMYPSFFSLRQFLWDWGTTGNMIKTILLAAVAGVLYWRFRAQIIFLFRKGPAILVPALFLTFGQVGWSMHWVSPAVVHVAEIPSSARKHQRVLWFLFDEMDEYYSTAGRPPGVELPAFDRFRLESFDATNAYPPSNATLWSVPAYISGKIVWNAKLLDRYELGLKHCGERKEVRWSQEPSLFSEAKELGARTAIVGWYHPYCDIFREVLDECISYPFYRHKFERSLLKNVAHIFHETLWEVEGFNDIHDEIYRRTLKRATDVASDPGLDLVLVHWPIPHHPLVDAPESATFHYPGNETIETYFRNLILADHAFGEIRRSMVASHQWNDTTILITSDHWWRYVPKGGVSGKDSLHYQVPFIVKLAGETNGTTYEREFSTILLHDLILSILRGEISTVEETAKWIGRHENKIAPQFSEKSLGTLSALPSITCASQIKDLPATW